MHILRDKENASLDLKNIARKNKLQKFQNIWYMSKFMHLECTNLKRAELLFEAMAKLWTLTQKKKSKNKNKKKVYILIISCLNFSLCEIRMNLIQHFNEWMVM
jgi:hypothetical protein